MEVNANSTSNSNSDVGKMVPFAIDLNEMPDEICHSIEVNNEFSNIGIGIGIGIGRGRGSGRGRGRNIVDDDEDDEVVLLKENVVLRCVSCGKREFGERRDVEFKCSNCLVTFSGSYASGGGFGSAPAARAGFGNARAAGGGGLGTGGGFGSATAARAGSANARAAGGGGLGNARAAGGGGLGNARAAAGGMGSGGANKGKRKVLDLDMNAMPPEAEGDGGGMFMAAARRGVQSSHAEGINVQGTYSSWLAQQPLKHTQFKLLQINNGSNDQNTAWFNRTVAQPRCEDSMVPVSFLNIKRTDPGDALEEGLSRSHATLSNHYPTPANQVYLDTLRETISEWGGSLGDGWHVEFVFSKKRLKTFPVYHAPDGSKFRSMSDVASHLGMRPSCHIAETKYGDNGVATMQKGSRTSKKRKEAPGSSRNGSHGQKMTSSDIGPSSGSEILIDQELHSELCGFPVQFEDFFLISAGDVDVRPSYHTASQFWPVGYKSSWHDKITGSIFVSEVTDGGDEGPLFKVKRYPCTTQTLPICSTVLRPQTGSSDMGNKTREGVFAASASLGVVEDTCDIHMMLTESAPPHLKSDPSLNNLGNEDFSFGGVDVPMVETENLSERAENTSYEISGDMDVIGEFLVEERSTALVWKMVAQTILKGFDDAYKLNGRVKLLFCSHNGSEMYTKKFINLGSLSKFSRSASPNNIPYVIDGDVSFKATCETLEKWLGEDRFGLDVEFVQEIIEHLPRVAACTEYKNLKERTENPTPQTVGSGFFVAQRTNTLFDRDSDNVSASLKKARKQLDEHKRDPHPPGQQLSSRLPAGLMGDALQAWEFSWRFSELLGLEEPFSFQELQLELLNPWLDRFHPLSKPFAECSEISGMNRNIPKARTACQSRTKCSGFILEQMHGALLKILAGELLSRVAVYADPNFDSGETKSKRGRKKESEIPATVKKMMLDMLPINEFTWPEVSRRYVLAVLSMECNLDSSEIACRESRKVFHCLRGDGGTLCGSLTGVAGLEADAVLLAEAMKKIFGSPTNESDGSGCKQLYAAGPSNVTETKSGCLPEWALALEPVRKLPTNVGARIRRCIHEALDKDPPEWARKALEHSISKEVYKGNASGPTKRAVVSVLTDLGQKIVPDRPEKKEAEECVVTNVTDLVMKQCRIVLRRVAAADEDRMFCNLLGRTLLKANENDDEGLLGYPAMVSRPLDFRSIDLRLTAGSYCGSHEAFYDDVQQVWHNIHTAFKDQPDSIKLAEKLSKVFEELYDKEVLAIVQKTAEYGTLKEIDNLFSHVSESLIPKAPWEDGICKVCGMDKDDDNVLLCDGCDSEYHRYCLNPPLVKIPEGNWYCPSCVSGESTSQSTLGCFWAYNQYKLKKRRGVYKQRYMETLGQLANAMMIKEYWELTREERLFLLKFLCDEVLSSAVLRDHIDQCASLSADLQQKLRSLTSELKIQRLREEISGVIAVKDNLPIENGESRVDVLVSDNKNSSRLSAENGDATQTNGANIVQDSCFCGEGLGLENKHPVDSQQQEKELGEDLNSNAPVSSDTENQRTEVEISMPVDPTVNFHGSKRLDQPDLDLVKAPVAESGTSKNEISVLQDAIATVESELLKISVRKEFLGRDSHGRIYWAYSRPGCSPSIIANGPSRNVPSIPVAGDSSATSTEFNVQKWYSSDKTGYLPNWAMWMSFNSDSDIDELVEWLQDFDEREKELKESILNWRRSASKIYTNDTICKKEGNSSITSNDVMESAPEFPFTKALASLKKKIASCPEPIPSDTQKYEVLRVNDSRICRCECLEPLYPSRHHCLVCHQTFITDEEHKYHTDETCKAWTPILRSSYHEQTTPFNLEEIMTKFIVPNSLKKLARQVRFIAPDGANCGSTFVPDLADQTSSTIVQSITDNEIHNSPTAERNKLKSLAERNQSSYVKDKGPGLGVNKSSIIHEVSQRPLVGRVSEVLRCLKISLLDMDAALPEEALRTSRSYSDRRRAWRSFTKYAGTIYEMIQATITLEDTIKSDFLRNDWWYWASPSAAAKITTVSALALRIFSLDSAILYDKSDTVGETEKSQKPVLEQEPLESSTTTDNLKPDSPSMQRTPDPPDIPETTRLTRSRASKRRRDSVG